MRIPIQNPKNAATDRAARNFILSAAAVLLAAAGLLCLAGDTKTFLTTLRSIGNMLRAEEPVFYYAVLGTLLLIFTGVVIAIREKVLNRRQDARHPPVTYLNFDAAGVTLEKKNPRLNRFFPYAETDFTLSVRTAVLPGGKGRRVRAITGVTLSFTQNGKTLTVQHAGAMPFIFQMLDEGSRFRRMETDVRPESETRAADPEEELSGWIRQQISDWTRYRLRLRYDPAKRSNLWFINGFLVLFGLGFTGYIACMFPAGAYEKHFPAFLFALLPLAMCVLVGLYGCWLCWKDVRLEKRLKKLRSGNP